MKKVSLFLLCMLFGTASHAQREDEMSGHYGITVPVDGLSYYLNNVDNTAMIANGNQWTGELDIPEQVTYEGENYTVTSIEWLAFNSCISLTKVKIPKTVSSIQHYAGWDDCKNPFNGCTSLEAIVVDEENAWMCSEDGVLFSKDKSRLFCYPTGSKRETYSVPDGVSWIGGNAFAYNPYLTSVHIPNSVTYMSFGTFSNCKNLSSVCLSENINYIAAYTFDRCESLTLLDIPASVEGFAESVFRWSPIKTLVIRGIFPRGLRTDTFYLMDSEVVAYVQQSEMEKFKNVFPGTVLPLETYTSGLLDKKNGSVSNHPSYNLQGRRSGSSHGVYIRDGRKVVVK